MDEEVKFVLERLIRENPNRRVIVLERSRPTEDVLFEPPIAVYGRKPTRRIADAAATGDSFEARWPRTLGTQLAKAEPLLKASVVDGLPRASREHVLRERFRDSLRDDTNFARESKNLRPALERIRQRVCA